MNRQRLRNHYCFYNSVSVIRNLTRKAGEAFIKVMFISGVLKYHELTQTCRNLPEYSECLSLLSTASENPVKFVAQMSSVDLDLLLDGSSDR